MATKSKLKKKSNWGGSRGGGRPSLPLEEKLRTGKPVTIDDYIRAGVPIDQIPGKILRTKAGKEYATTQSQSQSQNPAPADQFKILRCDLNRNLPRCGKCDLCLDGGPEYWESENAVIAHLFGDGNKKRYLGWPE